MMRLLTAQNIPNFRYLMCIYQITLFQLNQISKSIQVNRINLMAILNNINASQIMQKQIYTPPKLFQRSLKVKKASSDSYFFGCDGPLPKSKTFILLFAIFSGKNFSPNQMLLQNQFNDLITYIISRSPFSRHMSDAEVRNMLKARDNRDKFFSCNRFSLFIGTDTINISGQKEDNSKLQQLQTPPTKLQFKEQLRTLIEAKENEIRELKKIIKVEEKQLSELRHEMDKKSYEVGYFKKKICEQIQRSKDYEKQIEAINQKITLFLKNLEFVNKLKNPLQLMKDNRLKDGNNMVLRGQENQQSKVQINQNSLLQLQRSIKKLSEVFEVVLKIKKQKSSNEKSKQSDFLTPQTCKLKKEKNTS